MNRLLVKVPANEFAEALDAMTVAAIRVFRTKRGPVGKIVGVFVGLPVPFQDLDAPIQGVAPWKGGFANYMIH
jgi:hypothetical protein